MIVLYGFGSGFGLPEISPYVTKTEVQLRMAGLDYRKEQGRSDRSPKGQLPFVEDDGELIADSTFIRAHIEEKYGVDLDRGLDASQRAQAWTVERMVENHLGWCMVHARWVLRPNFEKGPAHFFDGAPEGVREGVYRQVNANVRAVGIGRHSDDEIADLGEKSLAALCQLLGGQTYMMGDRPTSVDAIVFGQLAAILTPYFDSPLRRHAEQFETITAYADRMMARFYPDFARAPARQSAAA
ncbi:MAG: glutathione S-transferase [Caulobacteraceae bacterium]|nr:glutathione S-transferase [Caulobacteraceae bacterium]